MDARTPYPLVVGNWVPLFYRGFALVWFGAVVLITWVAWSGNPPDAGKKWPYILLLFWLVGLFVLRWSFSLEAGRLIVSAPGSAAILRGPPLRRERHRLERLHLALIEGVDDDNVPYFKLRLAAPGGPLIIREGHDRPGLERLKTRIEEAFRPHAS